MLEVAPEPKIMQENQVRVISQGKMISLRRKRGHRKHKRN